MKNRNLSRSARNRRVILILASAGLMFLTGCATTSIPPEPDSRQAGIEDALLRELSQTKMIVIPDFHHDSLEAVGLPMKLIRRWQKKDFGIKKLIVGLETETNLENFHSIQQNKYYQSRRFATIAPQNWAMNSTREISWLLFLRDVLNSAGGRFGIFGFENTYYYYDPVKKTYLLPHQVGQKEALEKIPSLESQASFDIKYAYSRFFREYMSFSTIMEEVQKNPGAHFLIIIGSGHTIKNLSFGKNDKDWIEYYKIDQNKYLHPLGHFLKSRFSALVIQTVFQPDIKESIKKPVLFKYLLDGSAPSSLNDYITDYCYALPCSQKELSEEVPMLVVPSKTNLSLLKNKRFQLYFKEDYINIAKKIVYLMTGIVPLIKEKYTEGDALPCTFVNPETNEPLDYDRMADRILPWYQDGTFLGRVKEDLPAYNHRLLFKSVFQRMGKTDFSQLTEGEGNTLLQYLLAVLTVIGTEEEQAMARRRLAEKFGRSNDLYHYFNLLYGIK
jgi:hypothetical protein